MFNLNLTNVNVSPLFVVYGEAKLDVKDRTLDPTGLKKATIAAGAAERIECENDTDEIAVHLTPMRGQMLPATFNLQVENPNANAVRAKFGDANTGALDDMTINPGATVMVVAVASWRIALSMLGVTGEHEPPNDGFVEGNG